jgi:hypothetical protein
MSETVHVSNDDLEQYYLETLPEPNIKPLEEHLFRCGKCLDTLNATHKLLSASKTKMAKAS